MPVNQRKVSFLQLHFDKTWQKLSTFGMSHNNYFTGPIDLEGRLLHRASAEETEEDVIVKEAKIGTYCKLELW